MRDALHFRLLRGLMIFFRKFGLMQKLALIFLLLIPLFSEGQKEITLKRKYLGNYKGTISDYKLDTGNEIIAVGDAPIYIELTKDDLTLTVGTRSTKGTYKVMFEAKTYYLVDAKMEGQLATERIMVYKRGRHIARDGMYPQPVTDLKKFR